MICNECPRNCGAKRLSESGNGFCSLGALPKVTKVMLHMWEEPCISGTNGSGAIFFSGCNLKCVYCQNYDISAKESGKYITVEKLRELMGDLEKRGAHNINLVTPSHYASAISEALEVKLNIPVVYNCGGYESLSALKMLEGKVNVYLADFKYADSALAEKYSFAKDYPEVAVAAIREMYRQVGDFVLDENGIMQSGLIVRHLVLPGKADNTKGVLDIFAKKFSGKRVMLSLMGQYVPFGKVLTDERYGELNRKVSRAQYRKLCDYMDALGIEYGYTQELSSASSMYTPDFECNI